MRIASSPKIQTQRDDAASGAEPLREVARVRRQAVRRQVARVLGGCVLALWAVLLGVQPMSVGTDMAAAGAARSVYRYDRALAFDAQAEHTSPHDPRPYCDAGQVLALQQLWPAAIRADHACIARSAGRAQAEGWLALGDALRASINSAAARDAWKHAAAGGVEAGFRRLALDDEQTGRLVEARRMWLRLPPRDSQALTHLGVLALVAGESRTARQDFVALGNASLPSQYRQIVSDLSPYVATYPSTGAALADLGGKLLADGFPAAALQPLRAATRLAPSNGRAWALQSWAEEHVGQRALAQRDVAMAGRYAPLDPFVCFVEAEYALAQGQTVVAAGALRTGLTTDPQNVALWLALASLQATTHDEAGEGQSLRQALRYDTTAHSSEALAAYDAVTGDLIDPQGAVLEVSRATARWPENGGLWLDAAQVYATVGQPDAASDALHTAQRLDPTNPQIYVLLGEQAASEQHYLVAAFDFHVSLALRPTGPDAARARSDLAPLAGVSV